MSQSFSSSRPLQVEGKRAPVSAGAGYVCLTRQGKVSLTLPVPPGYYLQ